MSTVIHLVMAPAQGVLLAEMNVCTALKRDTSRASGTKFGRPRKVRSRDRVAYARKLLEEFDFDLARGLKRDLIAHLGTLDFVVAKDNLVFLDSPGSWQGAQRISVTLGLGEVSASER